MERLLKAIIMVIMCNESYLAPIQENTWELNTTLSLPIPEPKYRTKPRIEDPGHIVVRWNPVKVDENNPIFGFKVKLWEDEKIKQVKIYEEDGEQVQVEEWVPVNKSMHVLPTHAPAFEAVLPPDVFEATFDVKLGVHYELRAQTFNAYGDGPLSTSYGFRINTEDEEEEEEEEDGLGDLTTTTLPPGRRKITIKIISSNVEEYIEHLKKQKDLIS